MIEKTNEIIEEENQVIKDNDQVACERCDKKLMRKSLLRHYESKTCKDLHKQKIKNEIFISLGNLSN